MELNKAAWVWISAAVSAVLLASVAVVAWVGPGFPGTNSSRDSRAYSIDSGTLPLDAVLARGKLHLPACLKGDLRYAFYHEDYGYWKDIYLKLHGNEDCMNTFLAANRMTDSLQRNTIGGLDAERPLPVRPIWLDQEIVAKLGWPVGENQKFQDFDGGTQNVYSFDVLIQTTEGSYDAYVYGSHLH